MSETSSRQSEGTSPSPSAEDREDAVDVIISYPLPNGRFKAQVRSAELLLANLRAWKAEGRSDIWLSWGETAAEARARLEATLAAESIDYTTPPAATKPPSRTWVLLTALGGVLGVGVLGFLLSQKLNAVGEGLRKVGEEQRARDEQIRNSVGRTLNDMRSKTLRDLDDADPSVRLQAVARIGELYSSDPQAVPALLKRVSDSDQRVRLAAILILGKTRTNAAEVAKTLRDQLTDGDENVRKAARIALEKLGELPPAPDAAPKK